MAFADVVLARLDELGRSIHQAEEKTGCPQGYTRGVVRNDDRRATPDIAKATEIARALGLELCIGPPRPSVPAADPDAFALIPLHEAELSAGAGAEGGDGVEGMVASRRDWLARLGVIERSARLARIRGDSMEPLLRHGDILLIDTARNTVRPALRPASPASAATPNSRSTPCAAGPTSSSSGSNAATGTGSCWSPRTGGSTRPSRCPRPTRATAAPPPSSARSAGGPTAWPHDRAGGNRARPGVAVPARRRAGRSLKPLGSCVGRPRGPAVAAFRRGVARRHGRQPPDLPGMSRPGA